MRSALRFMQDALRSNPMTQTGFDRMTGAIAENARAMRAQVERLGGIVNALRRGHGSTLTQQLIEIENLARHLRKQIEEG